MEQSIKINSQFNLEIKRSKFLAFSFYIETEAEATAIVKQMKAKYADARHVCYAYVCGFETQISKSSDDGEPSGSAGMPILSCILKCGLKNVLVVVVRYFGGVLLGKGTLARTYGDCAKNVLEVSGRQVLCVAILCQQTCTYSNFAKFEHFCNGFGISNIETTFDGETQSKFWVEQSKIEEFLSKAKLLGFEPQQLKSEVVRI